MRTGLIASVSTVALASMMAISGCNNSSNDAGSGGSGSGGKGSGGASNGGSNASGGVVSSGGNASGGSVGSGGSMSGGTTSKGGSSGGGAGSGGSSGGKTGSGGAPASGGSGGGTTPPTNCTNGATCGGDLVGTWNVTSSCLNVTGDWDVSLFSFGCPTVPINGSLHVTGSWTANGDGTYTDNTTTTGTVTFPLSDSCLSVSSVKSECSKMASGVVGWSATCSTDASGQCNCTATANQKGGIGVVSPWAANSGDYTTSASGLNTDGTVDYSYCVAGNTLTLTPKPTVLPITGTVVLQKNGTTATGGTSGAGGAAGAGGAGGRTGSGGATVVSGGGGGTGSGGRVGSGGATVGSGGKTGTGGTAATGGSTSTSSGTAPCDIYAASGVKCVAAHSTVRVIVGSYSGPLYQVKRASDGTTQDIGSSGGFADSAAQDTFCKSTTCTITRVYDQSGNGNLVAAQTPDTTDMSPAGHSGMTAASATKDPLTVGGHSVYSLYTNASQAYWHDGSKSGMQTGANPQGIYMVTNSTHVNTGCCYDYGNGETSRTYVAGPSMDSIYFGSSTQWAHGAGSGPWIMADMEDGMVIGNTSEPSITYKFVTAIEKNNGTTEWALRGGDATTGSLTTGYKGALPAGKNPMKKQGSIVLGSGGDCCYSNNNASAGTFYEGAIVSGYPSDATEDAVQVNIVAAQYGK